MLKVMLTATALSFVAVSVLGAVATMPAHAEDAVKAPSWGAVCGFKWREYKASHAEIKGRDEYLAFQRRPVAEGGCGAKAGKGSNDDAIKAYLLKNKPGAMLDGVWLDARGKGGSGKGRRA